MTLLAIYLYVVGPLLVFGMQPEIEKRDAKVWGVVAAVFWPLLPVVVIGVMLFLIGLLVKEEIEMRFFKKYD